MRTISATWKSGASFAAVSPRDQRLVLIHRPAHGQARGVGAWQEARRFASSCARCWPSIRGSSRSTSTWGTARPTRRARRCCRLPARPEQAPVSAARSISPGAAGVVRRFARGLRRVGSAARARGQVLPRRGRGLDDGDGRKMEEAATAYARRWCRSRARAGDRQPREHPLRARRDDRGPGAVRAGHRRSTPNASRRTSISATSITISGATERAGVLPGCRRLESRVPRRTLLPGGNTRKDRAFAGSEAALEARIRCSRPRGSGRSWRMSFWSRSRRRSRGKQQE